MINLFQFYRKKRRKTLGLILGSGGAKGLAHIPVLEHLEQMGIQADIIVGSSMGAVVAAVYGAESLQEFTEDVTRLTKRDLLSLVDLVIPRSGILEGKKVLSFLENYIPGDLEFSDLKVKLGIVATDYASGKSVLFTSGNVLEAVRASISVPGVFVPVRHRGALLIDGGVSSPLPVHVAKNMGANVTVAVNLHRSIAWPGVRPSVKTISRERELVIDSREVASADRGGEPAREDDAMPSIVESIVQTIDIMEYINTMLMLKYNHPTVLVEPDVGRFGTMDFASSREIMDEGKRAIAGVSALVTRKLKHKK